MEMFEHLVMEPLEHSVKATTLAFDGIVGVGAVGAFGPSCDISRGS